MTPRIFCLVVLFCPCLLKAMEGHIPEAYQSIANRYGIPPTIFYAIALQESGYSYKSRFLPWPWTLNINGQGYRFMSRREAYLKLKTAFQNRRSIDVCIMQINLRWHMSRFEDLWASLEPMQCLKKGAEILQELFEVDNDWWTSVGRYHAPGKDKQSRMRAERYRKNVRRHWSKLTDVKL